MSAHATSSADIDIESMLKQALGRIESLERQHEEMKTSMEHAKKEKKTLQESTEREIGALQDEINALKSENKKALQASTGCEIEALKERINFLERKNNALKWSVNQLSHKVQENWEYPVTIPPDEYWQNKGYDDQAISQIKRSFIGGVKEAMSQLDHGVCDLIHVSGVNHDEALMPHWNALFRSF